jgi:purine-cytosine permease-like protein
MTEDLAVKEVVQSKSDHGEFERESVPESKLLGLRNFVGMYLGHYFAWIAAALLYSMQLQANPSNTSISPGLMAQNIAGLAGIVCVIVAGWTTANPTMYRAGLALQIVWKKASRFTVTLVAGAIATLAAIFPALAMKLLDFVALYGLVFMPMGAVIFIDFWLLPKMGLKRFYAEVAGISFNWAAGAAWIVTLCIALLLNLQFNMAIFFLAVTGWFIAAIIYVIGSKIIQKPSLA